MISGYRNEGGQGLSQVKLLLDAVVGLTMQPIIRELANEAKQPIRVKVVASHKGDFAEQEIVTDAWSADEIASGEIRVLVRESGQNNFGIAAEAIIKGISPGSGFSGFSVKGKLKLGEGQPSIKISARTNRYNVWEWSKDFRF